MAKIQQRTATAAVKESLNGQGANLTTADQLPASPTAGPLAKFQTTRRELCASLIEREGEIDVALAALVCGEHPLFVGPPGTSKSMLVNAVAAWMDAPKFHYLLTKFTDPSELCGMIDLAKLQSSGAYERSVDGYLPTATVAFLDETFKGSSAILNTLLTILNERQFHFGRQRVACPLRILFGASNETPSPENGGADLNALWDRFLLRKFVSPISGKKGRTALLRVRNHSPKLSTRLTLAELDAAQAQAAALPVSDAAWLALDAILDTLAKEGIRAGDRRVHKSVSVAQAAAWLDGSATVEVGHLEILSHVLWDAPEHAAKAAEIVGTVANPGGLMARRVLSEAAQVVEECAGKTGVEYARLAIGAKAKITEMGKSLKAYAGKPGVDDALAYLREQLVDLNRAALQTEGF